MTVDIRKAAPADAESIFRLVSDLATYERAPDAVVATPEGIRLQLEMARPPFECLLAEEQGEAVGFALFFHNYSTWLGKAGIYIEDIFVRPEHRKRGIGTQLFRAIGAIALERECGRVEWAVLDWNQPAIDFYRKLGATSLDEWTIYRLTGRQIEDLAKGK